MRPHFFNTTPYGLHGDVTCNIVSINFHIWYEAQQCIHYVANRGHTCNSH